MNIGGNLGKLTSDLLKQSKEQEKISKAFQKEINGANMPAAILKKVEKLFSAQSSVIGTMAKNIDATEKAAKEMVDTIKKNDGGSEMQLLKELEKSINQQGEIVKKLIKNASK